MKNILEAVNYIHFMFDKGHWKQTPKSKQAYDMIADFVEQKHKDQFNNNEHFAKLYVYIYGEFLKYFEGTVMDDIPQKELNKILKKPFQQIVEEFIDKHQDIEYMLQIPKEIRYKHPREAKQDYDFKFIDKLDYQDTEDNLVSMVNFALNN